MAPLTRVDHNFASGIARGALETRSSMIVIGWDARRTTRHRVFGTVLDQLLEETRQHVVVAKVGHPLNTTRRIVLLIPRGSDRVPGFFGMVRALKLMTNRLGAEIEGFVVAGPPDVYAKHLTSVKPDAPVRVSGLSAWGDVRARLEAEVRPDDLIVLMSARRGAISWNPGLARVPADLAELAPESFLVVFPSEIELQDPQPGVARVLAAALSPDSIVLGLDGLSYREAIARLLEADPVDDRASTRELAARLARQEEEFTTEIRPGVVVPHLRVEGLRGSRIFLGISRDGIAFPRAETPAHLVVVVLTPEEPPQEHLRQLARVARLVNDDARVGALREAESTDEVLGILHGIDQAPPGGPSHPGSVPPGTPGA